MPEDSKPQGAQAPEEPQRQKINSLDGFTNSPKTAGPLPPNQGNGGLPTQPSSNPNFGGLPSQPQQSGSPFSNGGVAKPTVTGLSDVPQMTTPAFAPPPANAAPVVQKNKSHKKLWMGLTALLVVLLLAGGYVFAFYLPNTPGNVYKSSLTNSGLAVDKLIDYAKQRQQMHYKSTSFDGKLAVKSGDGSFDANMNGDISQTAGQLQVSGDAMGTNVSANLKYLTKSGNTSPDVYIQVTGVKKLLGDVGLGNYAKIDGQWIVIDHTLIDTYKSTIQKEAQSFSGDEKAAMDKAPTAAQIQDAVDKVQVVNKQYIFTADPSKAVLTNEQYLGKETVNGRTQYHYKVGYNKANLKAYVAAVGQALDSSQLNDWAKKVDGGKNISDELDLKDAGSQIDKAKTSYTFDMWADKQTKLISELAFTDPSDKSSLFTLSQNYTGGTVYPFSLGFAGKSDDGSSQTGTLGFTVDSATNKFSVTFKLASKDSAGTTSVDSNFNVTPSNNDVKVTAPTGAKPFMDELKALGLGDLLGSSSAVSPNNPGCANPSLLLACSTKSTNNCPPTVDPHGPPTILGCTQSNSGTGGSSGGIKIQPNCTVPTMVVPSCLQNSHNNT